MLFAKRSGRIVSHCLGEMERGKQVRALNLLAVPTWPYLSALSVIAIFATIGLIKFCVGFGGVLAIGLFLI